MRRSIQSMLATMLLLAFSLPANAITIEGINVPDSVTQPGSQADLKLNGAGIRSKFIFYIYVGALYLPGKMTTVKDILSHTGPNRVSMHFLYNEVSQEKLTRAWTEGFTENNSAEQLKKLQARLTDFNKLFRTVVKGDVIVLDYVPDKGTSVSINGQLRGSIPGHDFNQALLKVWLGEEPADSSLKEAMLGKARE